MSELFDKHGGFRKLHSFTLATIVQLETLRFCRRFLTHDHREPKEKFYDPKGCQYDQMTQAARSGRQNIIEGSERSSTSKDTEMKLTDVARASLSELRGDYEVFIIDSGELPWSVHSPEARAVNAISIDPAPFKDDMVHESARHALAQRRTVPAMPAVRPAHAPPQIRERGVLGMFRLPGMHGDEVDGMTLLTSLTASSAMLERSIRSKK